jgi:predicted transcriptional regulator
MSTSFPVVACSRVFDYANAMNIRDLIESVGGIRAAARLLGVAPSTVHYYCKHDRMPIFRLLVLTKGKLIHAPIKEHEIERN